VEGIPSSNKLKILPEKLLTRRELYDGSLIS
jgi:hypothetical protein